MNIVQLISREEKAKGLIGMRPIPSDTLFVFYDIFPGQQFHSQGVLEPFEIFFCDRGGRNLLSKVMVPPHDIATAPPRTTHVIERKIESALSGESNLVYEKQSPHQKIELYKDGSAVWMTLNGEIQFHTDEADASHKFIVRTPLTLSKKIDKVLIIGGGDGLPAREALRHPIKDLRQVELDGDLVQLVKTHPLMRRISDDSFNNPRLNLMVGDGIQYVLDTPEKFDVIVDDAEFHVTGQLNSSPARYNAYMDALYSKLTPGGVLSYTIPEDNTETRNAVNHWMNTVVKRAGPSAFKSALPYIQYASLDCGPLGREFYLYLSNEPLRKRRSLVP
jgi:predicted membrane-bound spermidine synthase